MTLTIVLFAAYILGSVPTSYIVVYYLTGRDIRALGNGNPGTMNVWDSVGLTAALIVAMGDIGKGMAAVGLAYYAGLGDAGAVAAALSAVLGHDFSIFLRLQGGNGTAAAIGGMVALVPAATLPSAAVAIAFFPIARSRRIAGIVGMALVPVLTYWMAYPNALLAGVLLLLAVIGVKIVRFEGFTPARSRTRR